MWPRGCTGGNRRVHAEAECTMRKNYKGLLSETMQAAVRACNKANSG